MRRATSDEGLLRGWPGEARWRDARRRLATAPCEDEAALLWTLLDDADRSGALDGRWIQDRWRAVMARTESAMATLHR